MRVKVPDLLKKGDRVALLGPASPMNDEKDVQPCIDFLKSLGLRVKAYPSSRKRFDYLAGTDAERARDLKNAFANDQIKAIFCIRGGYGSSRLLKLLDWKAISRTPKFLVGFSDITSLIGGLLSQSRMASLHAPTPSIFIKGNKKSNRIAREALERFLFDGFRPTSYRALCGDDFEPQSISRGKARGTLIGGNVCLVAGLCGTPYMPKPPKGILFLEEVNEKPYKLDRYLTQLMNAGFFDRISGVALGQFTDCEPGNEDRDDALTVLSRCLRALRIPVLAGLPIGHDRPAFPLPMGVQAELDASKGDLKIL